MRSAKWVLVAGLAMTALAAAGCGSSGGGGSTSAATSSGPTGTSGGGQALTIKMGDYSFTPMDPTAKAGKVTITTPNGGQVEHEMVLLKTNQSPKSLPVHGDEVDEEGIEAKGVESPGEIEDVAPGQSKSGQFDLTPGKYVMICNLPGHFQRGMYGTLTVK